METKHMNTPWYAYHDTNRGPISEIYNCELTKDPDGIYHVPHGTSLIAQVANVGDTATHKANAAFIVKACNAHEELMEALQQIFEHAYDDDTPTDQICADFDDMREIARAALKKAEGN